MPDLGLAESAALFDGMSIRGIDLANRIVVSPMCMYSAGADGVPTPWHAVHLGSRSAGGAGLVFVEATGVSPDARITLGDLGLWNQEQEDAHARMAELISSMGSVPGIQLAHAGRKGGRTLPWEGNIPLDAAQWGERYAPSAVPFKPDWSAPHAMSRADMDAVTEQFRSSTQRAARAGFRVLELHFGHGYLFHQFLSPLANRRDDEYGGTLENRARFPLEVAAAVRDAWPAELPLFIRLSVVDWAPGGIGIDDSIQVSQWLKDVGVDLIDCSSGAVVPGESIPEAPLYHAEFARLIRTSAEIPTSAVGRITTAEEADDALRSGAADLAFIGRSMLKDPYWPRRAADALGATNALLVPLPYRRSTQHLP